MLREDANSVFVGSFCDALVDRMFHCRSLCWAKGKASYREPVRKRKAGVLGSNSAFTPDVGTIGHMSFNHSVSLSFVK